MGLLDFLLKTELANIQEFGIDELEDTKNPKILKEKLANYEYYTEGYENE